MSGRIVRLLDRVDELVEVTAESLYSGVAAPLEPVLPIFGGFALVLMIVQWFGQGMVMPVSKFLTFFVKYAAVQSVVSSWAQFSGFYTMWTDGPSEVAGVILSNSTNLSGSLNEIMDQLATGMFDQSEVAAQKSGIFSVSLISIMLLIIGMLMSLAMIILGVVSKIGFTLSVGLAPFALMCLLWDKTEGVFASWFKWSLGFALIPVIQAGLLGIVMSIGVVLLEDVNSGVVNEFGAIIDLTLISIAAGFTAASVPQVTSVLTGGIVTASGGAMGVMRGAGEAAHTAQGSMNNIKTAAGAARSGAEGARYAAQAASAGVKAGAMAATGGVGTGGVLKSAVDAARNVPRPAEVRAANLQNKEFASRARMQQHSAGRK